MSIDFVKMHGIGNDFVIFDDRTGDIKKNYNLQDLSRQVCDRRFGVGADGIILIGSSDDHDFSFRIYNSDGSSAQMCGNGMRCVARYLYDKKITDSKVFRMDTLAGTVIPEVIIDENDQVTAVSVDMGPPELICSKIPFDCDRENAVEEILMVGDQEYRVTTVSMGNPHAVLFVEELDGLDIASIGRSIELHERFPEKTNVEFIQVINDSELNMRVWERGAGITLACGTGACAAMVAASLTGRVDDHALIHLDGGDLEITWDKESGHLFKQGPAEYVFNGTLDI